MAKETTTATADRLEDEMAEPILSKVEARRLLYQRCLDAGWAPAKARRYLNRVLPLLTNKEENA